MENVKIYFGFISNVLKKSKIYVCGKVVLSIIQGAFPVINALLPQYLLDSILIEHNIMYFVLYAILFVCLQFFVPFLYSFIGIGLDKVFKKIDIQITSEMLEQMYRMQYELYENTESSNVINRAFKFVTDSGVNTFNIFLEMIALFITLSSYAYIIAKFDWVILIMIMVSVAINYFLMLWRTRLNVAFNNEQTLQQRKVKYYKQLLLNKYQARDMHLNNNFFKFKESYQKESCDYNSKLNKKNLGVFVINQTGSLFQCVLTFVIMLSFGQMLYDNVITVGEYTVSLNTSMQFSGVLFSFIDLISNVYSGILESGNYSDFLNMTTTQNNISKFSLSDNIIKIKFNNVSYKYFGADKKALEDISYEFCQGKIYAILGGNGSGKSTLTKLMLGLYKPSDGNVEINENNLENFDLEKYYKDSIVISQDFQFLEGISIKDNLNIDSEEKEEYFEKLKQHYGLFEIKDINNEYSKVFSENGIELSGGEKQKLANVRARLRSGRLVILDEPTSAIDYLTEEKIFEDWSKEKEGKIIIYITHNHRMAKYADEVLILDNGRLSVCGTYAELIQKGYIESSN